jgi:hypothetical protein
MPYLTIHLLSGATQAFVGQVAEGYLTTFDYAAMRVQIVPDRAAAQPGYQTRRGSSGRRS